MSLMPDMKSFRAFVGERPRNKRYDWSDPDHCACGQFAERVGVDGWLHDRDGFWFVANEIAELRPHTFGALAERINDYIAG